ncbi:MAG: PfkB family carbohydrate kinase, partial [Pseudomonadota bacterium]
MTEILTVTLNPALDFATSVPRILANEKLYCAPPRIDPGGGGVNVARAIGKLGGKATALVVTGGATGDRLLRLLSHETGVHALPFPVSGETRFSFAVTDQETGDQERFSLPGEALTATERTRLLTAISDAASHEGLVVVSGGVAPGLPDDFPQRIQNAIRSKTHRVVVDTSRAPLR